MTACYCATLRTATRKISSLYDEALAPFGINIAQYALLRRIERLQPVSFTQLGHVADLDRSTVSRNVRVLEKSGLVSTGRGKDDQREAVVSLAAPGVATLERALPVWQACQARMEARFGAETLRALEAIARSP